MSLMDQVRAIVSHTHKDVVAKQVGPGDVHISVEGKDGFTHTGTIPAGVVHLGKWEEVQEHVMELLHHAGVKATGEKLASKDANAIVEGAYGDEAVQEDCDKLEA